MVPHSNLQSLTLPPLGLTLPFSVAVVLVSGVAALVVTVRAGGSVV